MASSTKQNKTIKVLSNKLKPLTANRLFTRVYAFGSLATLIATTWLWSLFGAHLQQGNADQLVNSLLFEHGNTFRQATLPADHSLLLKWPLFWLVHIFGTTPRTFTVFTVGLSLITVLSLVAIIRLIEKRHLVFGTICLALASVLLLVPAQPYSGGLLPVNMAMLATRNIEYIVYILALIFMVRSPKLRSVGFWLAAVLLGVLVASDKLFLVLGMGAALAVVIFYAFRASWKLVDVAAHLVVAMAGAAVVGALLVWFLTHQISLTHLTSQTGAGPYNLISAPKDLIVNLTYAVFGLATNFGANPAFAATVVKNLPHEFFAKLFSLEGPAFAINIGLLILGLSLCYKLVRESYQKTTSKRKIVNATYKQVSLLLLATSLVAVAAFVLTKHYSAVDARYLGIGFFAMFITATTFLSSRKWDEDVVIVIGGILCLGILFGIYGSTHIYHNQSNALLDVNNRNAKVAQALAKHRASVLVGDYWRVIPTKLDSPSLTVMPLDNCVAPRGVLTSQTWQVDLNHHSFAYLLSFDKSLTGFPSCSLKQVVDEFGRPNASVLLAGTYVTPKEELLFYDHGKNNSQLKSPQPIAGPSTVVPVTADQLPYTTCTTPTIMNFVAHEDDDLLFMNPDLLHDLKAGHCVRSIYFTSGDAGQGQFYWLGREKGSEAAYADMAGTTDIWVQRIVKLDDNQYVTVANPRGNPKISLIFVHLPDGGLTGQGFGSSHGQSLAKLYSSQIKNINTIDGQSSYTSDQLTNAMTALMHIYQPAEIRTQANFISKPYPDHSDHLAVGSFVKRAYKQYEDQQYEDHVVIPLKFYIGYPVHDMAPNVSDGDLKAKQEAFFAYAQFDGGVCHDINQCNQTPTYSAYLTRQYQSQD